VRILLLTVGLLLVSAGTALAVPPRPSFTVTPNTPTAGLPAQFVSTSEVTNDPPPAPPRTITSVEWDFDNDGVRDALGDTPPPYVYPDAGTKSLRMRVTDSAGEAAERVVTLRVNAAPVAQFSVSPEAPVVGQEVLFRSFSYDPGGTALFYAWDTDGDGFDDGRGETTTRTFTTAGDHEVRLQVTDADGISHMVARTVRVGPPPPDPLPIAQFAVSPTEPEVGEQVSLRSFSYDPNGELSSQRWDLDGDGDFDENVHGRTAFTVFSEKGERIVRLEVRDSNGGIQTETETIVVKPQSEDVFASSGLRLMNPFPVVRLAGSVHPRGVRVRTLEAKAPRRSTVTVLCAGKSCPSKKIVKTAKKKPVRFKSMTRFLREGVILSVSVRKGGQIGKYTRWLIRGGKLPVRKDLCLFPNRRKAARCPS
jgi:PKD repeat protein